ncbi:hypothetical protein [Vulcanisaeta sp. JCM 16159]|uniref:hypothetical protein n=1 Tax=Vulcanisaeta sp. JCM 16159 TaxID=1295371 RepID=UPI0006D18DB0|nr:hypothetical protein [Vulcanisaeta sp. JCM 16159]
MEVEYDHGVAGNNHIITITKKITIGNLARDGVGKPTDLVIKNLTTNKEATTATTTTVTKNHPTLKPTTINPTPQNPHLKLQHHKQHP